MKKAKLLIEKFITEAMDKCIDHKDGADSLERINTRIANMDVLTKEGTFDTSDAYIIGDVLKVLGEELVYLSCKTDEEYRKLASEVVPLEIRNIRKRKCNTNTVNVTDKMTGDNKQVTSNPELLEYLIVFKQWLKQNCLSLNMNYPTFLSYMEKFKSTRMATFPNVDTLEILYKEWQNYIAR